MVFTHHLGRHAGNEWVVENTVPVGGVKCARKVTVRCKYFEYNRVGYASRAPRRKTLMTTNYSRYRYLSIKRLPVNFREYSKHSQYRINDSLAKLFLCRYEHIYKMK